MFNKTTLNIAPIIKPGTRLLIRISGLGSAVLNTFNGLAEEYANETMGEVLLSKKIKPNTKQGFIYVETFYI